MATIFFDGHEFTVGPDVTVGRVLAAACDKWADASDLNRFRMFDESGKEVPLSEQVGSRKLWLRDRGGRDRQRDRQRERRAGAGGK